MPAGNEFYFAFLVDRSGSMGGDRIEKAKEALDLFIRSLPVGCHFSVISFGSKYTTLALDKSARPIIEYNEKSKAKALEEINAFSANHGGTNIKNPLMFA